jgi:tetratricopeptide (TPR) repeat protein
MNINKLKKDGTWPRLGILMVGMGLFIACGVNSDRICDRLDAGERPPDARTGLEQAVKDRPSNHRARSWLAVLDVEEGKLKEAEAEVAALTSEAPGTYNALTASCVLGMAKNDWIKAADECEKVLAVSARKSRDLNLAAAAHLKNKSAEKALPLLEEVEKKDPDNVQAKTNRCYYYLLLKDWGKAEAACQEVIAREPRNLTAHKNLARAYYESKQVPRAFNELTAILALAPNDLDALANLAMISRDLKDDEHAKEYAAKALAAGATGDQAKILKEIINPPQPLPPTHSKSSVEPDLSRVPPTPPSHEGPSPPSTSPPVAPPEK